MQRFLLTLGFLLWFASSALALPSYCTLTGTVLSPDGTACAGCKITITTAGTQEVGGATFPGGKARSWTTESDGDLPAGVEAARTLIVKIQIDKGATVTVQIPDTSTADISTLLLEPIDVPSSTNINSLSGTLSVTKGGTGAAPDGDDQVLVSTGTTAADWETIPDCDGVTKALNYDVTTNTFTCNSTISATDLACTGCVAAADLASDAVTEAKLKAVDSPTDEECLTYESTGGDFEWQTCGGGGGGSGDIEVVGDCISGSCFTGGADGGNSLQFEGATADGFETSLTATDPTADRTITLPNFTGTVALERVYDVRAYGAVCDGATNDATAIQAAIDAAAVRGGVVAFPVGSCVVTSALDLDDTQGVILQGQGGRQTSSSASRLSFNLTGSGSLISAKSVSGLTIRDLTVQTVHASFTGKLIDVSHSAAVTDSTFVTLDNAYVLDLGGGVRSTTLLYLDKAHTIQVKDSRFQYGGYAIYGMASAATYSNVVSITGTYFSAQDTAPIWNPGDSWSIIGNTFQQTAGSTSVGIGHDSGVNGRGQIIAGNIFNDSTTGSASWITTASSGVNITGNLFAGHAAGSEVGVTIDATTFSGVIDGNTFVNLGTGVDCTTGTVGYRIGNNTFTSVTTNLNSDCDGGTTGTVQTTAQSVTNSTNNFYFNLDSDATASNSGFIVGQNSGGTAATKLFEINENGDASFYNGVDLRLYETNNTNYVQVSAPTLAGNWTLTLPTTDGATNDLLYNTDGAGTLGWRTPNAGTDITADLEEETHASEHSLGGADAVTVTNLASACTNGQVLGGTAGGTGVECQADVDTDTNASTLCAGTTTYLDGEGNCDDISSVYAPIGATFITQTASAALTGEQAMGSLGTGIVINTTTTGVQSIYAGASCTNQFPRALSASGAATCASVVSADITDGTITAADTALTGGVGVDINTNDIVADLTEIDSPTWSNGGSASLTHTWNLSGTDPVLTLQSGAFNLTGNTLIGGTASGNDLTLQSTSNATRGSIFFGSEWEWLDQIPDAADGTTYSGGLWNPTLSITGAAGTTSYSFGLDLNPTVNLDDASGVSISFMGAMRARGTFTRSGAATYVPAFYLLYADATNTSATNGLGPMGSAIIYDNLMNTYTSTGASTATLGRATTVWSNHTIQTNGGASTRLDVGSDYGFYWTTHLSETTGILNVTNVIGAKFETPALGGTTPQITTIAAVDIDKMTGATTDAGNIGIRNKSTTVFAPTTTQAIAAVGNTITCDETYKKFTTFTGTNALTSNPSITDGATGQICILQNVDATATDCITLTDSTLGMQLAGNDTLCPNDTITLVYDGTDWVETARSNN